MHIIQLSVFLFIFCNLALSMDTQLKQLVAQNSELQRQIASLEKQRAQTAQALADKQKSLALAQHQNKEAIVLLKQLGEKIFIIFATKKIDELATQTYMQLMPPTENPNALQEFADNGFCLFKPIIINEATFQLIYNQLKKSRKFRSALKNHTQLITYLAKETPSKWPSSKPRLLVSEWHNLFIEAWTSLSLEPAERVLAVYLGVIGFPFAIMHDSEKIMKHYASPLATFYLQTLKNYYSGTAQ